MGLDLWFRDDVMRILASTHEAMRASTAALSSASSELADAYQQGFADALRVVGIAFGVVTNGSADQARPAQRGQIVDGGSHSVHGSTRGQW